MASPGVLTKFVNCWLLRHHKLIEEDLWMRDGKIVDPMKVFFDEKKLADVVIDCGGVLIAPGFIDLQINGGFGKDFSQIDGDIEESISLVAKGILDHGVIAFCPTLVSSFPEVYHKVLPKIKKKSGGPEGAAILGAHCEGPFISRTKKGAHLQEAISGLDEGFETVKKMYGDNFGNIAIVTMAPEIPNALDVVERLVAENIVVSIGHSSSDLETAEKAVRKGASFLTHLYNAMPNFHHRDPGIVGLLASDYNTNLHYGIITDNIHTHPSVLRTAYKTFPEGLVIVTDAISSLGLPEGKHYLGQLTIEVRNGSAYLENTTTLCGNINSYNTCVQKMHKSTRCTIVQALEAGSLNPARVLNLHKRKGTLNYGADADFIFLNSELTVIQTWIGGQCVFEKKTS